jgi:cytoskeleton protein RodZ
MTEIGATLREARMRARIDVSEIEAQTKIRAKYLRALENEEWDLLPGPTFVKSFLRTYAQALGLDGKVLVEEFRLSHERLSEQDLQPIVSTARGGARQRNQRGGGQRGSAPRGSAQRSGPSRAYIAGLGVVGVIVVLLIIGLLSGGGSPKRTASTPTISGSAKVPAKDAGAHHSSGTSTTSGTAAAASRVALTLRPSGSVYVCLLGEGGRKLIPGSVLTASTPVTTYHSKHFVLVLGNNSVALSIDGQPRVVPPSSSAIGYSITKAGRHVLPAGQLPTCK